MVEYWFDPRHGGALRILRDGNNTIEGTDMSGARWFADVVGRAGPRGRGGEVLEVDFTRKGRGHHGAKVLKATYGKGRNTLEWNDGPGGARGNVWRRLRADPRALFC